MDFIFDYDWIDVFDDSEVLNEWIMDTIYRILFIDHFSSLKYM